MARCRNCEAEIRWVTNESGKGLPLDADPIIGGRYVLQPSGDQARLVTNEDRRLHRPTYRCHWNVCKP
jgi:hypothetical protein